MKAAIRRAGISPGDIDYINAHGTSTPLGDEIELKAVETVGRQCRAGSISHVVDQVFDRSSARRGRRGRGDILPACDARQVVPPTINLDNPSVATAIDLVPHKPRKRPVNVVLSNSFGFGGTNASLVFRRLAQ